MPSDSELRKWLSLSDEDAMRELFDAAYRKKLEKIGKRVSIRGLIEFSNICAKNCYYCGIRKGNRNVNRFRLEKEEVLAYAERALELHYGSLVLQSGEIESEAFTSGRTSRVQAIILSPIASCPALYSGVTGIPAPSGVASCGI